MDKPEPPDPEELREFYIQDHPADRLGGMNLADWRRQFELLRRELRRNESIKRLRVVVAFVDWDSDPVVGRRFPCGHVVSCYSTSAGVVLLQDCEAHETFERHRADFYVYLPDEPPGHAADEKMGLSLLEFSCAFTELYWRSPEHVREVVPLPHDEVCWPAILIHFAVLKVHPLLRVFDEKVGPDATALVPKEQWPDFGDAGGVIPTTVHPAWKQLRAYALWFLVPNVLDASEYAIEGLLAIGQQTGEAADEPAIQGTNAPRTRDASGEAAVEGVTLPPLTPNQTSVITTIARFDGSRLLSAAMIAKEMHPSQRLSERTIGPIVRRLIELDLGERPEGDRSGARLTTKGRRLAAKIAD